MTKDSSSKPKHADASSPYYLSGQAIPGNYLTIKPLKGDNYATWEQTTIVALKPYSKLGFVDGSISIAVISRQSCVENG